MNWNEEDEKAKDLVQMFERLCKEKFVVLVHEKIQEAVDYLGIYLISCSRGGQRKRKGGGYSYSRETRCGTRVDRMNKNHPPFVNHHYLQPSNALQYPSLSPSSNLSTSHPSCDINFTQVSAPVRPQSGPTMLNSNIYSKN